MDEYLFAMPRHKIISTGVSVYEGRQKILQLARLVCKSVFYPEVGLWGGGGGKGEE